MDDIVIHENEKNEIFDTLEKFIVSRLGYSSRRKHVWILSDKDNSLTARFHGYRNDLHINFGDCSYLMPNRKCIVIIRIAFREIKHGNGTYLINELCKFAKKYDYDFIEVQQPNVACKKFMKKLGFTTTTYLEIGELFSAIQKYQFNKTISLIEKMPDKQKRHILSS